MKKIKSLKDDELNISGGVKLEKKIKFQITKKMLFPFAAIVTCGALLIAGSCIDDN